MPHILLFLLLCHVNAAPFVARNHSQPLPRLNERPKWHPKHPRFIVPQRHIVRPNQTFAFTPPHNGAPMVVRVAGIWTLVRNITEPTTESIAFIVPGETSEGPNGVKRDGTQFPSTCDEAFLSTWLNATVVSGGHYENTLGDRNIFFKNHYEHVQFHVPTALAERVFFSSPIEPPFAPRSDGGRQSVKLCYRYNSTEPPFELGNVIFHTAAEIETGLPRIQREATYRIFLHPGWNMTFDLYGRHFSAWNRLAFKILDCSGPVDRNAMIVAPLQRSGWDTSSQLEKVHFEFSTDFEATTNQLPRWKTNHQNIFLLCFYEDGSAMNGLKVGNLRLLLDHQDASEMVGFIILVIMGIPLICLLTISCYSFKHRRMRKKLRRIRLVQQRDEIEARLMEVMGMNDEF
eukprot:GHVN01001457.1.p1 GENE.GHVN01001457.1~~GHVN01001457.1.p1  ORF type:complete len:402 (-),score=29.64 GHVN01001457.1:7858-9063(-)